MSRFSESTETNYALVSQLEAQLIANGAIASTTDAAADIAAGIADGYRIPFVDINEPTAVRAFRVVAVRRKLDAVVEIIAGWIRFGNEQRGHDGTQWIVGVEIRWLIGEMRELREQVAALQGSLP